MKDTKFLYFPHWNKSYEEVHQKKYSLSTHAERRTFVINSLRLGIPSEVIIGWIEQKDFEALKSYIKIVDELKRNDMNKFNLVLR
ncbi:integrase [Chryseobacterium gleum]|uniref:integrase n=1 Tax=Chryseobacterium gleum TaxID=250 RepID=UPI0031CE6BAD